MYKRVFLLVFDSLGIGNGKDAKKYDDVGSNTLNSVLSSAPFNLPCLSKLGFLNLSTNLSFHNKEYQGIITKINPTGNGKDNLTGHLELMGIKNERTPLNFYKNGFPQELIDALEEKWGMSVIGNKLSNDQDIIKEFGEKQLQENSIIVYTTYDSTLNILANESIVSFDRLCELGKIAREVTNNPEWLINKVIVKQFLGTNNSNFTFTNNSKTYTIDYSSLSYLDNLKNNNYDVITIGSINELFNNRGITYATSAKSNIDAMDKVISIVKGVNFNGLCYVSLSEYDLYGHLRNPLAFLRCLEDTDVKLRSIVNNMRDDDLLIITSTHGNDPGFKGYDHTREQLPLLAYSSSLTNKGHMISAQDGLASIGATINENFNIKQRDDQIGNSLLGMIK